MAITRRSAVSKLNGLPATRAERWREGIKIGLLIRRVQNHALGQIQMTNSELRAALKLIDKVLPDPRPLPDEMVNQIKDISAIDPRQLLTVIEGDSERVNE